MPSVSPPAYDKIVGELVPRIDAALDECTRIGGDCPAQLAEAIRYSLLGPGKRLRPILALMAARACGGSIEAAMPAACAVEMIHAYSLVHDDLPAMDDDDLRRGRPTCHKAFDEATAVLVGDALQALAFETVAQGVRPPEAAAECCRRLARAAGAEGLVGGQADDLHPPVGEDVAAIEAIHRRKTGAMIVVSLELGAMAVGGTRPEVEALAAYGQRIGLAFQIADDLLDVRGDEQALGKRVGKDADRGKLTFPGVLGIDESVRRAERLVAEACQSLAPFGPAAEGLEALARYIVERNH